MKKSITLLFAMLAISLSAQGQEAHDAHHHEEAAATAPAPMSTGEVVKVDKAAGKITLRHGPLENLGMPGMTMAFRVIEPAMLDQVTPGDKVRFVAEKVGGALTIATLQRAQ